VNDLPFQPLVSLLRRPRTWDGLAILFLAAWPFVFFWRVSLGQQVFAGDDITSLFLPAGRSLAAALAEGRLPLWTPDLGAGFPIFAEGHIAALYPPNLILYSLLPTSLALSYSILLDLAWVSVGMYVFARLSECRIASALLAGFIIGFNGFMLAHVQHVTLLNTACWLPWLLALQIQYQRALHARRASWFLWFLGAALVIALEFLGGFPQIVAINLGMFAATGLFAPMLWEHPGSAAEVQKRATFSAFLKSLGITVLCALLGIGISAVQWLPAAELLGYSVRAEGLGLGFFASYSLEPSALTQFVFPFQQLGTPSVSNLEFWAYIGLLPITLLGVAAFLKRDPQTWFFLLIGLLVLSLTLGDSNPLYALFSYVPVFNRFRSPARFLFLFIFVAAFLAGTGFEELLLRLRQSNGSSRVVVVLPVAGVISVFALIAIQGSQPAEFWTNAWTPSAWFFLAVGTVLVVVVFAQRIKHTEFALAVLSLTVFDLVLFAQPFVTTLASAAPAAELDQVPRSVGIMDGAPPPYRVYTNIFNETFRPNHLLIYGKESPQIYSPLGLQRNENYLANLSSSMLNLLNVRYLVQPSGPLPPEFSEPTASVVLDVFQNEIEIPPTRTTQVEMTSYTDKTENLPDGLLAGEIALALAGQKSVGLPVRIGIETGDWAYAGLEAHGGVKHSKPARALSFPGYLLSIKQSFDGFKYVARYDFSAPLDVTSVHARSYLTDGTLTIESILLNDQAGRSTSLAALAHRNDFALVFRSHAVAVLENRDVLPRAFLVHSAEIVSDESTLPSMRNPDFRPDRVVLLNDGQPLKGDDVANSDKVSITEYKPERVVLRVESETGGYLVLADSWYPGWEASVDGKRTSIERADYIFRSVWVPPGEHTVVFEYHPASFAWGAVISLLSLVLVGVLGIVGFRRWKEP